MSVKAECTFVYLNLLITGLCNSSANSFLDIISFLIVPPHFFYQKIYQPLKQFYVNSHHIVDF